MFLDPMLKAGEVVEVTSQIYSSIADHKTHLRPNDLTRSTSKSNLLKVSTFKPIEQNVLSKDKYTGKKWIRWIKWIVVEE